jgi:hypothetical protein
MNCPRCNGDKYDIFFNTYTGWYKRCHSCNYEFYSESGRKETLQALYNALVELQCDMNTIIKTINEICFSTLDEFINAQNAN